MPLSKRYIDLNAAPITFDVEALSSALEAGCPDVTFAFLMGSAMDGVIKPHGDLDLAFFTHAAVGFAFRHGVSEVCAPLVGDVRCDIGVLNAAEVVYRFEALKGHLLFTRDQDAWLRFYSVTCREYEHQMFRYERQRRYRLMGDAE